MKNIINGEECCFRCGMSKKEVRRDSYPCSGWGKTYRTHMWTVKDSHIEKTFTVTERMKRGLKKLAGL